MRSSGASINLISTSTAYTSTLRSLSKITEKLIVMRLMYNIYPEGKTVNWLFSESPLNTNVASDGNSLNNQQDELQSVSL